MKKIKFNLASDIICLIASIVSIFFGTFWYIALAFSILPLIYAISSIRERGNILAKITTVFSILGIVNCAMIYISLIMIIISATLF